jgi:hypothetical protein
MGKTDWRVDMLNHKPLEQPKGGTISCKSDPTLFTYSIFDTTYEGISGHYRWEISVPSENQKITGIVEEVGLARAILAFRAGSKMYGLSC